MEYQELLIPIVYLFRAIVQTRIGLISRSIEHHCVTVSFSHLHALFLSLNYRSPIDRPF